MEERTVLMNTETGELYKNRVEAKKAIGGSAEYNKKWRNRIIIPIRPSILIKASSEISLMCSN